MSKPTTKKHEEKRYWLGLDWGQDGHAVSVVDDERALVQQFKVGAALEDLRQHAAWLHGWDAVAGIAMIRSCAARFGIDQAFQLAGLAVWWPHALHKAAMRSRSLWASWSLGMRPSSSTWPSGLRNAARKASVPNPDSLVPTWFATMRSRSLC